MNACAITENRCDRIAQALDPASIKIDGRNNRDRLAFVAAYSQLILYYDQNNQLAGNWQSFFLKEPCILLAAISKTDYSYHYSEFVRLGLDKTGSDSGVADSINRLIPLLKKMFETINQWFYFLNLSTGTNSGGLNTPANSLAIFLKDIIEEKLASQLSLMVALQQAMSIATKGIVKGPDPDFYRRFEPIWFNDQRSRRDISLIDEKKGDLIGRLSEKCCVIFHSVFDVFVQVIEHATQVFYQQENQVTPYPDTALLMAFSRLMEAQQKEINQLGVQHLDFYYDRILQQRLRPAQADEVFVCLTLADKAYPLNLPAGTLFKAGSYPDTSEILFANDADIEINHAAISSVSTLYYDQSNTKARGLYLNTIAKPSQILRNSSQEVVAWDGFGNTDGLSIQQGFAFASPMLFLQGGVRTITITLTFASLPSADVLTGLIQAFEKSQCYLSTEKAWLNLNQTAVSITSNPDSVSIKLSLQPDAPAIVAFPKNPDGFSSVWPIFKMILDSSVDLTIPPMLAQLSITTQVEQFSHFSLANNLSALPNTGSQLMFGPMPEVGDCFYVGSNECFAKPLSSLELNINWDKLPEDFSDYYLQYNRYLFTQQSSAIAVLAAAAQAASDAAFSDVTLATTQAKGTSAEAAVAAAKAAATTANTAVHNAVIAIKAAEPTATTADTSVTATSAVATASAATAVALAAAATASAAAVGTAAATAAATAERSAEAAAIATTALAFNNTCFVGRWSSLTANQWQPLNTVVQWSSLPPVAPFTSPATDTTKELSKELVNELPKGNALIKRVQPAIQRLVFSRLPPLFQPFVSWIFPFLVKRFETKVNSLHRPAVEELKKPEKTEEFKTDETVPVETAVTQDAIPLFQQSPATISPNLPNSSFIFSFSHTGTPTPNLAVSPLPGISEASDGYIRFDLEKPTYAFGNSLYAQVISFISFENGLKLIESVSTKNQGSSKLLSLLSSKIGVKDTKQKTAAVSSSDVKSSVPAPTSSVPFPNPPYSPKLSSLQGGYTATATTKIVSDQKSDTQAYPLELYHYGSFKPYLAYDATGSELAYGFSNLVPKGGATDSSIGLPLFPGVSGQGCLYISLSKVVAPCTLRLFAEISGDENLPSSDNSSIGYYYWTKEGWHPLKVLQNDTNNFTCSGIIVFDVPPFTSADLQLRPAEQRLTPLQQIKIEQAEFDLSYLASPIMSSTDFWLAIATKSNRSIKLSYLDTQAVKLSRVSTAGLPVGEVPQIDANTIGATQNKVAQIASIAQPFPSFGGLPAENKNSYGGFTSFYRRVSERLNNKDRSVTSVDFVAMAHSAYMNLFYAKVKSDKGGVVRLGLVKAYPNAQVPNAFRPVVDALDQVSIFNYIASRTSAMTRLSVFNLKHQVVKISTQLLISSQVNANAIEKTINQQLKIYLSPWIESDLPQRRLTQGINQAELINFLSAQTGVVSVLTLSVMLGKVDNDDESVLVSDDQHDIKLVVVAGSQT